MPTTLFNNETWNLNLDLTSIPIAIVIEIIKKGFTYLKTKF